MGVRLWPCDRSRAQSRSENHSEYNMIHDNNGWEEDDEDFEEVNPEDEWVLACGFPDCCMPGYHFRYECHNAVMIEDQIREAEPVVRRSPDADVG
jgi:hypothetical protein